MPIMLTRGTIEKILSSTPQRIVGVLGDLFLDRYLDIDPTLTEPSIETGLDAYQVVRVRSYPGAAGAGEIIPISMIGDDGEGHELRQALQRMPTVQMAAVVSTSQRRTPTYTKPMLGPDRELNRLDIKNRQAMPAAVEAKILDYLSDAWSSLDVLLVLDQVSEPQCGVVTERVRDRLAELAGKDLSKPVIVDSRERIGLFRNVWLKPNERECLRAAQSSDLREAMNQLVRRTGRPVICTQGAKGMLVLDSEASAPIVVPGYEVKGPIDTVGAGDSSSAAMACALASGTSLVEAAAFGNLVASITIQQIGTTGVATPEQVRAAGR
jgi:bifunctional ADP-heptose synthase (sugar kinase/adenylyltransferase)